MKSFLNFIIQTWGIFKHVLFFWFFTRSSLDPSLSFISLIDISLVHFLEVNYISKLVRRKYMCIFTKQKWCFQFLTCNLNKAKNDVFGEFFSLWLVKLRELSWPLRKYLMRSFKINLLAKLINKFYIIMHCITKDNHETNNK